MYGGVWAHARWSLALAVIGLGGAAAPALAADFGGDCCADLEERIAELEATTARKGNRKVSLNVYGQVNEAVMFWDDGYERNAYVVTNDASWTRFGFKGGAKINKDWSANFLIEIGLRSANSKRSTQSDPLGSTGIEVRHSWWNLKSETYGTFQIGHMSTAQDGITEINLAGTNSVGKFSDVEDSGLGFFLRSKSSPALSGVKWYRLLKHSGDQPGDGDRREAAMYISPKFAGFTASAAWGGDDNWDAAVRYEQEVAQFQIEAGIAYGQYTDAGNDSTFVSCVDNTKGAHCRSLGGAISILHEPTGLYTNFAAGWFKDDDVAGNAAFAGLDADNETTFWAAEAGIRRQWHELGPTTLFGQYYALQGGANARETVAAGDAINSFGGTSAKIYTSDVTMWGVGIAQDISKASIKLYTLYRHFDADVTLTDGATVQASNPLESLDIVMTGAIIKF